MMRKIMVSIILLCWVFQFGSVRAQVTDPKMQMQMKITYEIYSGRNSPYFEIDAPGELSEIRRRLEGLRESVTQKPAADWSGTYLFKLAGEGKSEPHLVSVSKTNIAIQQKDTNVFFDDSKSLRKYLDNLRISHGLKSAD